jgi:hypothetical protein
MISEDYRQLFGSANARSAPQTNRDIPPAPQVPGLGFYLADTFTKPVSVAPPPPAPTPLAVSGLAMSPDPVRTSGAASFAISSPGSVTVQVLSSKGSLVRTLLSKAPQQAGPVSSTWDRTDSAGRKVKRGTYKVTVNAVDATGQSASSTATFSVF